MDITKLANAGGIFFLLTFVHFVVDWIFQTHKEAMVKHTNHLIRAKHCIIYTIGFIPIMFLMKLELWEIFASCLILFFSHFIQDTYITVYLWAKYIRKPSEMFELNKYQVCKNNQIVSYPANDKEGFIEFVKTPLGKILAIVVDQIIHLTFLIPVVWLALN